MDRKEKKSALEAMMFTWGHPLETAAVSDVLEIPKEEAYDIFQELKMEYDSEKRGIRIREINGAFQFVTHIAEAEYIERLCTPVKIRKLSQSALEVLAIVAYKQPVTKGEIEAIRGIRCDRVMEGLINKELVMEKGRSDVIGRPILYGTTDYFLRQFNLKDISQLPDIDDIEAAIEAGDDDSPLAEQIELEIN